MSEMVVPDLVRASTSTGEPAVKPARPTWQSRGLPALITIALTLAIWLLLSLRSPLVAPPQAAFVEAINGLRDGWLRTALASTLGSVLVGFGAAFITGLFVAMVLASSNFLRRVFDPLLAAYGAIPRVVFFPALLSIFGLSATSKQAMGYLSAIYPLIVTVTAGIVSIPPALNKLSASLRLRGFKRFRLVVAPAALPSVLLAARLGFSIALISVIISEYFGARSGLGVVLSESYARLNTDRMYAVVLTIAVIATVTNMGLWSLQRRLSR